MKLGHLGVRTFRIFHQLNSMSIAILFELLHVESFNYVP